MKRIKWSRIASNILLVSTIFPAKKYNCNDNQTLVALTFDDGYSCWTSIIMPILKRYGLTATGFVNDPDRVQTQTGREIIWSDIRELYNAGWEIGWHTAEHIKVTTASPSALIEDFRNSQDLFKAHGLPSPVTFAYPSGWHNRATMATTSSYFLAARTTHAGVNSPYFIQEHPADLVATNLHSYPFARAKAVVDKWTNKGVLIIFAGHTVGQIADWQSETDMSTDEFQAFAEFLYNGREQGDFDVVTLKEGVQLMKHRQVTSTWSIKPDSPIDWHLTHSGFAVPQRCFDWYNTISHFVQHRIW